MRTLFVWAVIAGCNGADEEPGDGDAPPVDPTPVDGPTFVDDVRPMLAGTCVRCHGPSLLAPTDFLDYEVAKAWAEVMIHRVEAGEMPPAAADPDCHPYQGDEVMTVSDELVPTLRAWVAAGTPSGDLTKPNTVAPWVPPVLPRHDVELRTAGPYVPEFVDGNEYRCFLLDDDVDATFVTGIEFLMDRPEISHHALLFVDPDGGSEQLVEDSVSRSWRCPDVQPEPEWSAFHAWAPSGGAVELDEGLGLRITQGSQLILQMHYFEQGEADVGDQPGYALMLADQVEEEMYYLPVGPDTFTIPAGAASHTETLSFKVSDWFGQSELHVYGVMPHMHVLGTGYDFSGSSCISRSDSYDFAMQPTYWFDEPVVFLPGQRLSVSCTYDNSADNPRQLFDPPVDVSWGEDTQQEMCYALMYGVLR